jgi:hypothetical protein
VIPKRIIGIIKVRTALKIENMAEKQSPEMSQLNYSINENISYIIEVNS